MAAGNIHNNLIFKNVTLAFRPNFSGSDPHGYNDRHQRYFDIKLDDEMAKDLADEGWPIRTYIPKNDPDNPVLSLRAYIRFDKVPPRHAYMIIGRRAVKLNAENVGTLDYADISNIDVEIRPYNYTHPRIGTKAMVDSIYVEIRESELYEKYADIIESSEDDDDLPFDVNGD